MYSVRAANSNVASRPLYRRPTGYRAGTAPSDGMLAALDRSLAAALPAMGGPRPGRLLRIAREARQLADDGSLDEDDMRFRIARLGRTILVGQPRAGDVAAALGRVHGAAPFSSTDADLAAAAGLLMGCLVMTNAATLSGPAVVVAAAAAALSRVRVHVLCADATQLKVRLDGLRPLAGRLGFSVDEAAPTMSPAQRRWAYRADVVCTTVEQIGLDFLRDRRACPRAVKPNWYALSCLRRMALPPGSLFFEGLHLAIADGAKRVLVDKAVQPLALHEDSEAYDECKMAADANAIAAALVSGEDYEVEAGNRIVLQQAGRAKLEVSGLNLQGMWSSRNWREAAVCRTLAVRHAWCGEHDYTFKDGRFVALSEDLARALEADRGAPSLRTLIEASHGQSRNAVPVAQLVCHRALSSYCRLSGLAVGAPGLASEICKHYRIPATRVGAAPRGDSEAGCFGVFVSQKARATAVLDDAMAAQVDGAEVIVVSRDDVVVTEVSHILSEGRDLPGRRRGLVPEGLHLLSPDGRHYEALSPPVAASDGSRHLILAGVEEYLALDAETMAHWQGERRTTWSVMLTRQEVKDVALGGPVLGAFAWLLACMTQQLTGGCAGFVLKCAARQRQRQLARQRSRILHRSQAARRALAFAQDLET